MDIIPILAFKDNYIWLIVNRDQKTFICVDPGDAQPVLDYAEKHNISLTHILVTHHHADHIGGIVNLIDYFPFIKIIGPNDLRVFGANQYVENNEIIKIDNLVFKIIAIPGHTSSHICYFELNQKWLFCGDTLFSAGCGKVFDGTIEDLHNSLQILKNLNDNTKVFCGHEYTKQNLQFAITVEPENNDIQKYLSYLNKHPGICTLPSTIELEKKINPFFRTNEDSLINYAKKYKINSNSLEIFKLLRLQKNQFTN